jgi:LysM repeat protein
MNKDLDILKAILLEAEEDEKAAEDKEKEVKKDNAEEKADDRANEKDDKPDSPFDKDPMGFILKKYHTLNALLEELMTPAFKEYITAIFIQSPKPTSFKIVLHNSQFFYLSYMGDGIYQAIIAGKRHYLSSIGEKERAMKGISRLLQQGSPLKTKGPEGAEQGTRADGEDDGSISGGNNNGGGDQTGVETTPAAEEEGGEETEPLTEAAILKGIIMEAFTVFPKSEKEIKNKDIKSLFTAVKANTDIEDPIALDPQAPNAVNITRKLQTDKKTIASIKKLTGQNISGGKIRWNGLSIKFGEGSRGGRGVKSKGLGFEGTLTADLKNLKDNGLKDAKDFNHPQLVLEMANELGLKKGNFKVIPEGQKNQSRPLKITAKGPEIAFSAGTAAETLTDITIDKGDTLYYISAKFGGTLTFFNSGISTILPANEIKSGEIKNESGKILLKTLGINNKLFCQVFNDYGKKGYTKITTPS